jgi:hypothetical protein
MCPAICDATAVAICAPNSAAYGRDGKQFSLMEYILRETEQLHGKVRRYTSPDEHAFYPGRPT